MSNRDQMNFIPLSAELNARIRTLAFAYNWDQKEDAHDECMASLISVFDEKGNFPEGYDPYRTHYDEEYLNRITSPHREQYLKDIEIQSFLFDEDSSLNEFLHTLLAELISAKGWGWSCDAVRLYYAQEHGKNTSRSYPATYMWR